MGQEKYKIETEISAYIIGTRTKSELADDYGITVKTLGKKVKDDGGIWPKDRIMTPKQVRGIVELLGSPKSTFCD